MSAKFTPGPWAYDGDYIWAESIGGYVADPNTEDMTGGDCVARNESHGAIAANARLIAAAPELYEALRELIRLNEHHALVNNNLPGTKRETNQALNAARAALAKVDA